MALRQVTLRLLSLLTSARSDIKAEFIKTQADEAMRSANYGVAEALCVVGVNVGRNAHLVPRYSECFTLRQAGSRDAKLLSNRSLARLKCQRFAAARDDALLASQLEPTWPKAWLRLGAALSGIGDLPGAAEALACAVRLDPAAREPKTVLAAALRRCTREHLAELLLKLLDQAVSSGLLAPAECLSVSRETQGEAIFRHLLFHMRDKPSPGDYYEWLPNWLALGWSAGMAYLHRAALSVQAKCFAQAAADATSALEFFGSNERAAQEPVLWTMLVDQPGTLSPFRKARVVPLAWAWMLRGDAFAADDGVASRDWYGAAACYVQALDADFSNPEAASRLAGAASELSVGDMAVLMDAVYARRGAGWQPQNIGDGSHVCTLTLVYKRASRSGCNGAQRAALRASLAAAADISMSRVFLERVIPQPGNKGGLTITAQLCFGELGARCATFADHAPKQPASVFAIPGLGEPDARCTRAVCSQQPTPLPETAQPELAGESVLGKVLRGRIGKMGTSLARPTSQLALPYAAYRLVRADGQRVERADKHPFQLSRVFYTARDRPSHETWAELVDGTCRWRQSASEVRVRVLRVPPSARGGELDVSIGMRSLRVALRAGGGVLLHGELERACIPDESVWSIDGADGLVITLRKLNVELAASGGDDHASTWWPKLFTSHTEICWDDYEKDYSDLPPASMVAHVTIEHRESLAHQIESSHRRTRDVHTGRDEARRRARQERLHVLRGNPATSWVVLNRLNPAADIFGPLPSTRESVLLDVVRSQAAKKQADVLASCITR